MDMLQVIVPGPRRIHRYPSALMVPLGTHARRGGVRRFRGDELRGNTPRIERVRSLGGRDLPHAEDLLQVRASFDLAVGPPTRGPLPDPARSPVPWPACPPELRP
jgi:hypothetical protein